MKSIKNNHVNELMSKEIHSDNQSIRANPDNLDGALSMYEVDEATKEVQGRVHKLLKLAKQILTEQQYRAFELCMVKDEPLTEREAAVKMGISYGRVHQLLDAVRSKLERAYAERT